MTRMEHFINLCEDAADDLIEEIMTEKKNRRLTPQEVEQGFTAVIDRLEQYVEDEVKP